MIIPVINGIIRRRILLNYRAAPDVIRPLLPPRFQPKLVNGKAIVGICLIRLEHIRPKGLPAFLGISSENSAHRIAVEWQDEQGNPCEGVFVPRRDTNSRLNALAGGRLFPGVHHLSRFHVNDQNGLIQITIMASNDQKPLVDLEVTERKTFPPSSVFNSLSEASTFFEAGCIGYSSRPNSCRLDGLLLKVPHWQVSPLDVVKVSSSYFDDHSLFPPDTIQLDHAMLMRDIAHEWHSEPEMTGNFSSFNSVGPSSNSPDNTNHPSSAATRALPASIPSLKKNLR